MEFEWKIKTNLGFLTYFCNEKFLLLGKIDWKKITGGIKKYFSQASYKFILFPLDWFSKS